MIVLVYKTSMTNYVGWTLTLQEVYTNYLARKNPNLLQKLINRTKKKYSQLHFNLSMSMVVF